MRWLLIFLCAPAAAGDVSLMAETWAQDRDEGFGVEYSVGEEWRPSLAVSRYENDFSEASWYGGLGLSRSFAQLGEWDFSAGLYALYFKHSGEFVEFIPGSGEPFEQGGDIVIPVDSKVTRTYARNEYVAPSPALTVRYNMLGVSLTSIQLPNEDWSTSLQFKITL